MFGRARISNRTYGGWEESRRDKVADDRMDRMQ
jgi:hypothetical protein